MFMQSHTKPILMPLNQKRGGGCFDAYEKKRVRVSWIDLMVGLSPNSPETSVVGFCVENCRHLGHFGCNTEFLTNSLEEY